MQGEHRRRSTSLGAVPVDPTEDLRALTATLDSVRAVLDVDRLTEELADLESQAADPELWNDQERAQAVTSRLSYVRGDLERLANLGQRLADAGILFEMAAEADDADTLAEAERELEELVAR